MKIINISSVFSCFILLILTVYCFADNPIIQTNYTADPAPMVKGDTVYLYTSHDEDNAQGFLMNNWMLYTSTDLVNWRDHGIIASLKNFTWENGSAWAPQCVFRNNKYYLYCPLNKKGGNISIGVLVSDSPYGPFTDPLGKPLITGSSSTIQGANDYDPGILIDDDGKAYIYWGGNGPCLWAELNPDMISLTGPVQKATIDGASGEASYTEGPWPYKHNGKYYLAWASRCCPEGIGYAISDKPSGPWTCKGSIMRPNQRSSGNHPGLMDFKGKSYVFGFDYELLFSRIPYNTSKPERRSICMKEMTFDAAGLINEVPWWGAGVPLPSVEQVGRYNPFDTTQAETICWSLGVRTEVCKDTGAGMDVDSIHNGDFIKVKGVNFDSGATSFVARVASGTNGGDIELHLDTITGQIIGTCSVSSSGGWQTWVTKTCSVNGAKGVHDLYFKFTGGSGLLFNFNWWKFVPDPKVNISKSGPNWRTFGTTNRMTVTNGVSKTLRFEFTHQISGNMHISIFNASGRLIKYVSKEIDTETSGFSLPLNYVDLKSGTYIIRLSGGNQVLTKTFILK
jgi:hypothetical protein